MTEPEQANTARTRFFAHRASGYQGPLDQDGNRCTDPTITAILADLNRINTHEPTHQHGTS